MPQRKRYLTTAALGVALTLLSGAGVFALAGDSALVRNNDLATSTFTRPTHDIRLATMDPNSGECPAMYGAGNQPSNKWKAELPAAFEGSFSPQIPTDGNRLSKGANLCIGNFGTSSGQLHLSFAGIVSSEVSCEPDEPAVGDACTPSNYLDDEGEIDDITKIDIRSGGGTLSCGSHGPLTFDDMTAAGVALVDLPSRQFCTTFIGLSVNGSVSDDRMALAQTDRIQWTIVVSLVDGLEVPDGGGGGCCVGGGGVDPAP